ncbi:MAG: O-antigen ligase family protein [Alphaproteobacteria bacterium]
MGTSPSMNIPIENDDRREAYFLYALGFLFLPVAVLATAQVWVLAVVGVLGILAVRAIQDRLALKPNWPLVLLMLLLVGWALISSFWAINPDRAVKTSLRIALVCISVIVLVDAAKMLDPQQRWKFGYWLIGGTVTGLVLTGILVLWGGPVSTWLGETRLAADDLSNLNRTSTVIALLVWPVALIVARTYNRLAAAAVIILSALLLFALAPSTPLVAFTVGLLAFIIAWVSQRWGKRVLFLAFAGAVVMIPLIDFLAPPAIDFLAANLRFPHSEIHRLVIWKFAAERIFEHPLFGWGLDASRAIPGNNEQLFLFHFGGTPETGQALPLHPHNALSQIWLELGIVGVILVGAIFALIVFSIPRSSDNRAGPAALIATTACAFTIAQLGFGIWQGWWMATLGLTVMIAVATGTSPPVRQKRPD